MNTIIKMRYVKYTLIFSFILILSGCMSIPKIDIGSTVKSGMKSIFSISKTKINPPHAVKSTIITPKIAQPIENISGEWRGIMNCSGRNIIFDLTINNSGEKSIDSSVRAKMANGLIKEGVMVGTYDPDSSYFKLKQSGGIFSLNLEGIIDPESGRMSAIARQGNYYGQDCGYAIADRVDKKISFISPPANSIDTIIDYVEENAYTKENHRRISYKRPCNPQINKWFNHITSYNFNSSTASQLYPKFAAYDLLTNEKFQHYFGKSFEELSSSSSNELLSHFSNGCVYGGGGDIGKVIKNPQGLYRGDFIIYSFAKRALQSWRAHAVILIKQSSNYDSIITKIPWYPFTLLWPSGRLTFEKEILERKSIAIIDKLEIDLDNTNNDFLSLYQLSLFLNPYTRSGITPIDRQKAKDKITKRLNKHLISSSTVFLSKLLTIDDVFNHLEVGRYQRFNDYINNKTLSKINELFSSKRKQLIKKFILNEEIYVKNIINNNSSNIQKLEAMVSHDKSIRKEYSSILSDHGLKHFLREYSIKRVKLLDLCINEISNKLIASKSKEELRMLYSRYITIYSSENNLPDSIKKLDVIYLNTLKKFEPFYGLPGFEYLDAIYRGDYKTIRQLDLIYKQIAIESTNSKLAKFGISLGRSELTMVGAAAQKYSLIDPIITTYMFNYSTNSQRCLKPGYKDFSISVTEVTTTHNGLGDYISTNYGPTNVTKYTVNKEFIDIFPKVYKLKTNPLVFNGIDPINGTRKILNQNNFPCDSPQIKTFEKNLIKLFNKHHGYN